MINVSNEFRDRMKQRTDFRCHAVIAFADGSELTVPESGFTIGGNSITDGAGADGLPLGVAIGRSIHLSLMNDDDHLADYDFFGARIRLYLSFALSENTERIEMGRFTVLEPESYGETVEIDASDDMYKADRPYTTTKTAPLSLSGLYRDVCTFCGIPFSTAEFANDDFVVQTLPEDGAYTGREMLGFIAMIAGGNARVNRQGTMEIIPYDLDAQTAAHTLADWTSPATIGTDDILITGVQTVVAATDDEGESTETVILDGTEGYVLELENPLWLGKETTGLALAGATVIGQSIRKFEGEYVGYPIAEFMDTVDVVDRKGNHYRSVLTDIEFVFCGGTALSCSAQGAVRNSSRYISAEAKTLIEARRLILAEKTARETAVSNLAERLTAAGGLYSTAQEQEDGSTIYYLHDKPTLAESQNVMKLTADVIGFSTDGGETYPFGFAVTGEMIMGIIQAEGIEADWVRFGSKSVTTVLEETQEAAVARVAERYYLSTSDKTLSGGEWTNDVPERTADCYIWRKTVTTYISGETEESEPVCLSGTQGADGEDAVTLRIDSSRGTVFKNNTVSTVLSVVIYYGAQRITDRAALTAAFGTGVSLEWSWQRMGEDSFGVISAADTRLSNDGFMFTLSAADVDSKVVFQCKLLT